MNLVIYIIVINLSEHTFQMISLLFAFEVCPLCL